MTSLCQLHQLSQGPLDNGFAVLIHSSCGDLSTMALPSLSASLSADNVLFAIDNDNDKQEMSALDGPPH